jgi:hypothetical protein
LCFRQAVQLAGRGQQLGARVAPRPAPAPGVSRVRLDPSSRASPQADTLAIRKTERRRRMTMAVSPHIQTDPRGRSDGLQRAATVDRSWLPADPVPLGLSASRSLPPRSVRFCSASCPQNRPAGRDPVREATEENRERSATLSQPSRSRNRSFLALSYSPGCGRLRAAVAGTGVRTTFAATLTLKETIHR